MFNVGGGEIIVILLLALIVLGPDRLPDAAKKVGRFMGEARRMTAGFQEEVRNAMDLPGTGDALDRAGPGPRLIGPPPTPDGARAVTSAPEPSDDTNDTTPEPPDPEGRGDAPTDTGSDRGDTSAA